MAGLEFFGERWLIMGKPKVGKSEAAASFPDAYVINGDGPINRYAYRSALVRDDVNDWGEFQQALDRAQKKKGWRTLILDTADKLVVAMNRSICASKKLPSIGDIPHGAGWERQVARFTQYLEKFWSVAESRSDLVGSIIVAHSKKGDDGQSLVIRKALMTYIQGGVCNIAFAYKQRGKGDDGERRLRYYLDLSGGQMVEAGCRNFVLQNAGEVDHTGKRGSRAFAALCDLFSPDDDKMEQALRWLHRKGGIEEEAIREYGEEEGIETDAELFELIKSMRKSKSLFQKVKKTIEGKD